MDLPAKPFDVTFSVVTLVDASLPNVHCVNPKLAHRRSQSLVPGILDAKRRAEAGHYYQVLIGHHAGYECAKLLRFVIMAATFAGFPFAACLDGTELDW